jgi:hypothetical protein
MQVVCMDNDSNLRNDEAPFVSVVILKVSEAWLGKHAISYQNVHALGSASATFIVRCWSC